MGNLSVGPLFVRVLAGLLVLASAKSEVILFDVHTIVRWLMSGTGSTLSVV
jgi:hypothetical protein